MSSINQQGTANPLSLSDLLVIWSTANGDTRKASITSLLALIEANLTPAEPGEVAGVPTFLPFVGGINDLVCSAAAGVDVLPYFTGQTFVFFPVSSNTGASTINIASLGVKNIYINGAPCTGGEMVAGAPVALLYDGVRFQIVGTGAAVTRNGTETLLNKLVRLVAGAVGAPALTIVDAVTGFYRIAANNWGWSANGAKVVDLSTTGVAVTGLVSATGALSGASVAATAGITGATIITTGAATHGGLLDISGAAAGQISFPATQNPSAGANVLDDYEEGTWTPIDSSGAGLAFGTAVGTYTKIGRQFRAGFFVVYPATANGSSAVVGGSPFTSSSAEGSRQGVISNCGVATANLLFPANSAITCFFINNATGGAVTNATMSSQGIYGMILSNT